MSELTETHSLQNHISHRFDPLFPLPYRIAFEIILGIWGWGLNVQVLDAIHVDLSYLLRYQTGRSLHKAVYQFALGLSLIYTVSIIFYWQLLRKADGGIVTAGVGDDSEEHPILSGLDILPWTTFAVIIGIFLYPGHKFHHSGRKRVISVLKRVCTGSINPEHRLPDILLSDALTSYSKIFVDSGIMTCMLISKQSSLGLPDRSCGGQWLVPVISSIPFLIRLRQCTIEYLATGNKQHLFNFAKYLSAMPVILLSALQRNFKNVEVSASAIDHDMAAFQIFTPRMLTKLWVAAVLINSTYSFYWDITYDWDLELLGGFSWWQRKHQGLRAIMYFPAKHWYYFAICVDCVLRFTWSLKLSSHWYYVADRESGLFVLGVLEIIRRWVWVFFRVESEWVKSLRDPYKGHELGQVTPM
ncbi:Erd1p [Sugiyamaella lignohabitans]|uniref:Erd1p n=1 Tax=Sugiyamaella lignohabitans TaxID=796027 RepID=A0A167FU75_9ASCO|nr:Erd1p [Sugiyamaella lignohabitans]ANB15708.1 Erd1p [Sugiyamaella lignohabitans]